VGGRGIGRWVDMRFLPISPHLPISHHGCFHSLPFTYALNPRTALFPPSPVMKSAIRPFTTVRF